MTNLTVVGAQWGDEGKGKVVDLYTESADVVVRYGGGNNAGHTLVVEGRKVVLHLIPSGVVRGGRVCILGDGMVVDPAALLDELDQLAQAGLAVDAGAVLVSSRAHVVLPYHRVLDELRERGARPIGTTRRGVGPAYEDKVARRGLRVQDLTKPKRFAERLGEILEYHNFVLKNFHGAEAVDFQHIYDGAMAIAPRLTRMIADVPRALYDAHKAGANLLFEGAQGTLLDIDHGTYPFVTSSNCIAGAAAAGAGVGPGMLHYILGITKAYTTRVGGGPFPTELYDALDKQDPVGKHMATRGHEFGATTGRARRCGWFDAAALKRAIQINGVSGLCITKLDVLDGVEELKICTGYRLNGSISDILPVGADDLASCEPIYESLPGWKGSTVGVKSLAGLPAEARAYIMRMEELCDVPVDMISTGPDREETIVLRHPFE